MTSKRAVALKKGNVVRIGHQHRDGVPCYCDWNVEIAVVDGVAEVAGLAAITWHDAGNPNVTGISVVDPQTRIPLIGHITTAAAAA